jgi:hypothetical protein
MEFDFIYIFYIENEEFYSAISVCFNQNMKSEPKRHSHTVTPVTSNLQRILAVVKEFVPSRRSLVPAEKMQC